MWITQMKTSKCYYSELVIARQLPPTLEIGRNSNAGRVEGKL